MASAKLKAKISALRAKTAANGCTEAEALAAADAAARLMREHGLSDEDLVMTEASAPDGSVKATWRTTLSAVIAYCTNTAAIHLVDRNDGAYLFVGRAPGPEIAVYLRDVCFRAIDADLRRFKGSDFYRRRRTLRTKRQAAADFIGGLTQRLTGRLIELFGPSLDEAARQEAKGALARRFEGAVAERAPERQARYSEAAGRGWLAGGDVALNRGVGDVPAPRQIAAAR